MRHDRNTAPISTGPVVLADYSQPRRPLHGRSTLRLLVAVSPIRLRFAPIRNRSSVTIDGFSERFTRAAFDNNARNNVTRPCVAAAERFENVRAHVLLLFARVRNETAVTNRKIDKYRENVCSTISFFSPAQFSSSLLYYYRLAHSRCCHRANNRSTTVNNNVGFFFLCSRTSNLHSSR